MTLTIGQTSRDLRKTFGLTQRATAKLLGVSFVHLCNIERGHSLPSEALLDKFRDVFDVDLYVLAWCQHANENGLPKPLKLSAAQLEKCLNDHINTVKHKRRVYQ